MSTNLGWLNVLKHEKFKVFFFQQDSSGRAEKFEKDFHAETLETILFLLYVHSTYI